MIDEQRESQSIGQAVAEAVVRIRRVWHHQLDGPDAIAEYRRVLRMAKTPEVLRSALDEVIDRDTEGYLPKPGVFVAAIRDVLARQPATPLAIPPGPHPNRCPVCAKEPPGIRESRVVIVDERTGLASCSEGLHGYSWFVAGPNANVRRAS